jgi:nitrite reductase (cytochrome c-552)
LKRNFPAEYDAYKRTVNTSELTEYSDYGRYGGSMAFSKLDRFPNLKRLFAGCPFAVEYREERGHLRGLEHMSATQRLGDAKPGTFMTCKSSQVPGLLKSPGPEKFGSSPVSAVRSYGRGCGLRGSEAAPWPQTREPAGRFPHRKSDGPPSRLGLTGRSSSPRARRARRKAYPEPGIPPGTNRKEPSTIPRNLEKNQKFYATPVMELLSAYGIRFSISYADCHMPSKNEGAVKITDHWIRTPLSNPINACGDGFRHSWAITFENVQQLRITPGDLRNLQENCMGCHEAMGKPIRWTWNRRNVRCTSCHRGTGHAL